MKILKLLLSLSILGIIWFFTVAFLPLNMSEWIFGGGIVGFPFILGYLMKIFDIKIQNNANGSSECDYLRRSDYGDAHYDSAYSMMSGNIYNSDD